MQGLLSGSRMFFHRNRIIVELILKNDVSSPLVVL